MATKAGVWIDHRQAIVVLVGDAGDEIKKIKSGIKPSRPGDGSNRANSYTPNDFVAEDRLGRRASNELNKFYDEVIATLLGSKALLILGPGEAKGEFLKRLKSKKLGGVTIDVTKGESIEKLLVAECDSEGVQSVDGRASLGDETSALRAGVVRTVLVSV
jgi:hypothetical protein